MGSEQFEGQKKVLDEEFDIAIRPLILFSCGISMYYVREPRKAYRVDESTEVDRQRSLFLGYDGLPCKASRENFSHKVNSITNLSSSYRGLTPKPKVLFASSKCLREFVSRVYIRIERYGESWAFIGDAMAKICFIWDIELASESELEDNWLMTV